MRRHGSSITVNSGKVSLIPWRDTLKNHKKRRLQNGKLHHWPRNQGRNPTDVRGPARKSFRSLDATGKAREMDVPLSSERNALHGLRCASGRDKLDGGYQPGRHYLQTASHVSGDPASGEAGVHLGLGEIFADGAKD